MWLVARCHVMSCDVIWCVFILCDAISCVVWCHVMHCDVMWCPLMWWAVICCEVMRCNGMRSYEFVMHCGWLRCHVVWFEMVVWGELEDDRVIRTTQIYSVLHSTTKYYSGTTLYYTVLLQYYSVLQSTTPVLILYYKVLLQYYSVLESTTPVLLQYYSVLQSTTLYYKVLLQYYSVLQSTTPVLRCTTKYYSSAILYYKVLLQYYSVLLQYHSVLQRTTPVLVCTARYYSSTTKYYSSTSLYYKVPLQYYSVLHRTTPVLPCTTKYYSSINSVLQSTTLYYTDLHQYNSVLQSTTPVLLCTTKYYSGTTPCTTKYAFARREAPTSPNAVPATQGDSHDWSSSHMKRHLQCAEQQASPSNLTKYCACHAKWLSWLICVTYGTSFTMRGAITGITLQPHQILRLPRKSALQNLSEILRERLNYDQDPNMIRPWSEHELVISHPPVRRGYFSRFGDAFCIENYNISRSGYLPRFHRILRLPQKVTLQDHQMLRLPRKMTLMIDLRHIWNVIYNAQSNRHHPPTSPNTAPATQNDSHDWSASHMERHLQCAEQ